MLAQKLVQRRIPLAAFAQFPPSCASACFGVVPHTKKGQDDLEKYKALGAPQIIVLREDGVERWAVRAHGPPTLLETISPQNIVQVFKDRKSQWSPKAVSRAKVPVPEAAGRQLDFVDTGLLPALEHEAQQKLDELIVSAVRGARAIFERLHPDRDLPETEFFALLFGLLRAKVLRDANAVPGIDLADPANALDQVKAYYPSSDAGLSTYLAEPALLEMVAERVRTAFILDNLSAETLAYVYEHTLVTPARRRALGIHTTPPYVAEYILRRLPIGQIPAARRKVLDPMCGRGTLLVAALRRLRDLLPASMSARQQHAYLVSHLRGIDCESYSCEVAKLSLLLADLPNPNGWDVSAADSFAPGKLEGAASDTSILVANPPFEACTPVERELYSAQIGYKGGEMLRRALPALPEGALVGVVMPRKLLDGRSYEPIRDCLVSHFELIELACLPDRVFPKSEAQTVLVLARKESKRVGGRLFRFVDVIPRDLDAFRKQYAVTREEHVPQGRLTASTGFAVPTFWIPRLHSVWDVLLDAPRLGDFARVHRGVEYEPGLMKHNRKQIVRDEPFHGGVPGVADVADQLCPYAIREARYVEARDRYRRQHALGPWGLPWEEPKIVANAKRASRGPWRLVAAVDRDGLVCTDALFGMWIRERRVPLELLAAVLNGPVANAFVHDHEPERDNRKESMLRVPFPSHWETVASTIKDLVNHYVGVSAEGRDTDAAEAAIRIDAEILRAYRIPPREERRLLDAFWGERRPGMPSFEGYIPPDFSAWIPLHMYLSESFQRSTGEDIRDRGARTTDPDVIRFFERIS